MTKEVDNDKQSVLSRGVVERLNLHLIQQKSQVEVFTIVHHILSSDLQISKELAHSKSPQRDYFRRIYLRTLFSFSEGILFRLKQYLRDQREVLKIQLDSDEVLFLNEQRLLPGSDGKRKRIDAITSHRDKLKRHLNLSQGR